MKNLLLRLRQWFRNKASIWMFGMDHKQVLLLVVTGLIFAKKVKGGSTRCVRCSSEWFPQVVGRGFAGESPRHCPFCGKPVISTGGKR